MDLIRLLIYVLILCVIFGVVWWAINQVTLPQPVRMVVVVVLVIILLLVLLNLLGMLPARLALLTLSTGVLT